MSSLIQQIIEKIEQIPVTDGKMLMQASDFGLDFMNSFFTKVLKQESISLTGVTVDPGTDSIIVNGNSSLYGYVDLTLLMLFNIQNEEVVGSLTGTFPETYQPSLEVITWIKAGNISFNTSITEQFELVSFDFKVDIISSTQKIPLLPVEIKNESGDIWNLILNEGTEQVISIDELVSLFAGTSIDEFIPPTLASILNGIQINSMEVSYDTSQRTVSFFSIGILVTNGWNIVNDKVLLLPGMQINMSLLNPTDSNSRVSTANIAATFELGGIDVPIFLGATSAGGTTLWAFGIQPDQKVVLPSFSNLLGLVGDEDFMKSLPDGLSKIPQIEIDKLFVNFDTQSKVLTQLSFAVTTVSSWPVIDGYFSIERLSIDFDITNLTDPVTRTVYGVLYGLFKIGDSNYIMCSIQKTVENPDWTIIGGLAPGKILSLTAIALKFFEGKIAIPDGIPDFSFSVLQITVVPDKKSFEFQAKSASPWQITEKISINTFALDFSRSPDDPVTPIKGRVATSLEIASVDIDLSASLNNTSDGGWQFEGKSKKGDPILIGNLIDYVMTNFGVGSPPNWVKKIILEDIAISFNSTTKDFSFDASAIFTFTTTELGITVKFSLTYDKVTQKNTLELSGTITIKHILGGGSSVFEIDFKEGTTNTIVKATWHTLDPAEYLEFSDIVSAFGFTMPDIPEGLKLALRGASLLYDFSNSTLVFALDSASYGKSVFVAMKNSTDQKWMFYFGLSTDKVINLADLPILDKLTFIDQGKLEIDTININVTSVALNKDAATLIDKQIHALLPDYASYPQVPVEGIDGQFAFSMTVNIAGVLIPMNLVLGSKSSSLKKQEMNLALKDSDSDNPKTVWYDIQKNFGPLYFDKIGVGYKESHIFVLVNVSATASGLNIALNGFGIGVGIKDFDIGFIIEGIAISYSSGPLMISGGFQGSFSPVNLTGDILIKTEALTIAGIGGYTEVENKPSMFLFAVLNYPIGGPAFFFVTGLAAGFGFNRKLLIPDITGVATFPFVQWAMNAGSPPVPDPGKSISDQVDKVLQDITEKGIVAPSVGTDWLAAGISFTSFEILNSFLLLTVSFGTRLEFDLLGLSRVIIPPGAVSGGDVPVVAYAELAIKASYVDGSGLIPVQGQLTNNSYVLAPACHLTGGFAFYFWFAGDYEGDFVVTLGGYNPNYTPPPHYPLVPRLGINWQVADELLIKGNIYFALTSNAVMAGGMMEAVWESGGIKAWFIVQADFLIMWKPFHYDISASIDLGASFTIDLWFTSITMTIHVGVSIHIWGPEFTGEATIHLYIISFTIDFGNGSQEKQKAILWGDFVSKMLPQKPTTGQEENVSKTLETSDSNAEVCKLVVSNGLLKQLSDKDGELNWIVNPEQFELTSDSVIPSKDGTFSSNISLENSPIGNNTDFGVRPVGVDSAGFESTHSISITSAEDSTFHAVPILKNVPKGLWEKIQFDSNGNPILGDPVKDTTISGVLTGFSLKGYVTPPGQTLPIEMEYLQYTIDPRLQHFIYGNPYVPTSDAFSGDTVSGTIMSQKAQNNRTLLFDAIQDLDFQIDTDIDVSSLANEASDYLLAEPLMRLLGEEKTP